MIDDGFSIDIDMIDMPNFITKIENKLNEKKEGLEQDLMEHF